MLVNHRFALVDLETTGGQASDDQIMEVAVRLVDGSSGREVAWQSLIDPQCSVPPFIQGLTGIRQTMLRGKPVFSALVEEMWQRLDGAILVAHNARFDYGFLRHNFARHHYDYQPKVLCTLRLARSLYPDWPKHGLEAICGYIGFSPDTHHRAMADVDVMKAFLDYARADKGDDIFQFELALQIGLPVLPSCLRAEDLAKVANTPGNYRLYASQGELLDLGYDEDLQSAITGLFKQAPQNSKVMKLARQVRGISYQESRGLLGAALRGNAALEYEKPLLQNRHATASKPTCLRFVTATSGDVRLRLRSGLPVKALDGEERVAIFRDRKQAVAKILALALENGLCLRRLEFGKFAEGGACISCIAGQCNERLQESTAAFNQRVISAFTPYFYQLWPYAEPMLFAEAAEHDELLEWHLVDTWRYVASFSVKPAAKLCFGSACRVDAGGMQAAESLLNTYKPLDAKAVLAYGNYKLLQSRLESLSALPLSVFLETQAGAGMLTINP